MKLEKVKIENFRGYSNEAEITLGSLTAFIGKNDAGKSSILEALDIFFNENKGSVKIDKEDINKQSGDKAEIKITVVFSDPPSQVIIDSTNSTTLQNEYLLNTENHLEVVKRYSNAGKEKVYIKANHPTADNCKDLLLKKQSDLRQIISQQNINCGNTNKNADMRAAIWSNNAENLQLEEIEIDVTKEDAKAIWDKLKGYMPTYFLFQSDRKNTDGDNEIQDPMKLAVQQIIKDSEIQQKLSEVAEKVDEKLREVSGKTLEKLKEMNPDVASSLNPQLPTAEQLKWVDVFKGVSITGDNNIPINKRGSGVKRLILLNFFRAEAERKMVEQNSPAIVYAIEEPETSQYPEYQNKLIKAFIALSENSNTQILLTTHSPSIVKELNFHHLQLIKGDDIKEVVDIDEESLPYPSLNEVNFLAFNEAHVEYHNELYGHIDANGWLADFREENQNSIKNYVRTRGTDPWRIILSEYIRHQIHHPENRENDRYTPDELKESIELMREFIQRRETTNS